MSFLIELYRWFVHGSGEVIAATSSDQASSQPEPSPTKQAAPRKTGEIDFDLNRGANVSQFLEDIRSIQPLSQQFSKAREDLLAELKKLTPHHKN